MAEPGFSEYILDVEEIDLDNMFGHPLRSSDESRLRDYKLQVTFHHTDNPWWISISGANSDTHARNMAYAQNPRYQILCCKPLVEEDDSYFN